MKKLVLSVIFTLQAIVSFAQMPTGVTGKVVDAKTQKPLQSVVTEITNTNIIILTNENGIFTLTGVAKGNQLLHIKTDGYKDQLLQIDIEIGKILELGTISLEEDVTAEQQNNLVTISETALSDEGNGSEGTSSLLQASRDVFLQAAAFNFGQARFSVRGIDSEYANTMINGISMNRVADGRPQFGVWGGLNDATRNQEFTNGSAPSDYIFSGIAGSQEINTRASIYRKGTRISFLNTNTNYSYRMMGTHVSGMNSEGWAYVISAGRRLANEGYFEGTNYDANSFFASVEKRINDKHSLNFTTMLAQNKRGKNSPNTNEVNDLMGFRYNSYWGYQEGERRNSRFKDAEEPLMMLNHYWKVSPKVQLNTTLAYQTGKIGNSRFDFKQTVNPDPTYYRKLPSFYTNYFDANDVYVGNTPQYIAAANGLKNDFVAQPQLDWKAIYNVNFGAQNPTREGRIVQYEDRNDEDIITFNSNIAAQISDNVFLNGAINYQDSRTSNFKNMLDLLGSDFFIDKATFGFGDQQQSDLNNPNRVIKVGDKYGYNYNIYATKFDAFTQFKFVYKKIDFYLAQTFSKSSYQREGLYRNGYFPTNSFGKSGIVELVNFGFKSGFTYKKSGFEFIDFNAIYMTKAPNHKDVFSNARVNNEITNNVTNETIKGGDISYIVKTPIFKARLTGYYNEILNQTDVNFYYADGLGGEGGFVSEVVTGMNKKNRGFEVGIEFQLSSTLKLNLVQAIGEYTHTNNPNLYANSDDRDTATSVKIDPQPTYLEGYKQSGMPQEAYSVGLEYRDPKFWWIGANANFIGNNYVDVSTIRRTKEYYTSVDNAGIVINQNLADEYLKQEKFDTFLLFNLVGGKSWRFGDKTLGLFANVNNVLDTRYKTGGFEQSRNSSYNADFRDHQSSGYGKFESKYFYGYGRTYMVNIYLNF